MVPPAAKKCIDLHDSLVVLSSDRSLSGTRLTLIHTTMSLVLLADGERLGSDTDAADACSLPVLCIAVLYMIFFT